MARAERSQPASQPVERRGPGSEREREPAGQTVRPPVRGVKKKRKTSSSMTTCSRVMVISTEAERRAYMPVEAESCSVGGRVVVVAGAAARHLTDLSW